MNLRPSVTHHLTQRLRAFQEGYRQNLALLGAWGSGKTFQLRQLLEHPEANLVLLYCPLDRESTRSGIRRLLGSLLHAASSGQLDSQAEHVEGLLNRHLYAEAFTQTLELVPLLHQIHQRPCVVILDEFLSLDALGLSHAFHELGKRVMTWPFALFILASSFPYRAQQILREKLHLLFGQFELVSLGSVDSTVTGGWIRERLRSAKPTAEHAAFLGQWLGHSPWYTDLVLTRLEELVRMTRARRLNEELLIRAAWDVIGSPDGALHHWFLRRIDDVLSQRNGSIAIDALQAIARGARTNQDLAWACNLRGNLPKALQLLLERDVAQRVGMCWTVPDSVFRLWLGVSYAVRGESLGAIHQRFTSSLQDLWAQWRQDTRRPLAERISQLLGGFGNETVLLDHKTGRLPRFRSISTQKPVEQRAATYLIADGPDKRWCCVVYERQPEETDIASFERFCRAQSPRPSRKIVVAREGLELNAKLCAKEANMWVWEAEQVDLLFRLYRQPAADPGARHGVG